MMQSSGVKLKKRIYNVTLKNIPEDQSIGEIFNYQKNCVKVKCSFVTL